MNGSTLADTPLVASTLRAIFLDFASLGEGLGTTPLDRCVPGIRYVDDTPVAAVAEAIAGMDVVLLNKVRIDASLMATTPTLKFIGLTATGVNNIDLETARARGIAVCNIRDYCTQSVAQHVWGAILALTHHLREYDRDLKAGEWQRSVSFSMLRYPVRELSGRTLGIVGNGVLASGVIRIARAFGMEVLVAERPGNTGSTPGRLPLSEVIRRADVLSLHCPLTPQTTGLIGAAELARMKPDAVLVNTARGGLVDAAALADALRAGRLGGAAIDVLAVEPPVDGNPLLAADIPNLLVTPHTAWAAVEARQRALDQLAGHLAAWQRGEVSGRVI
jgi:glycerate dehydrogenase